MPSREINPEISKSSGLCESTFWLTRVRYLEEKKAVMAEFSKGRIKRTIRFPFFPSFLVSKESITLLELKEAVSEIGNQKFKILETEYSFKVASTNLTALTSLANKIFSAHKARALMPEPERQFLIEKEWGYFDSFDLNEKEPAKKSCFELPSVCLDFFSESIPRTIAELSKIDSEEAKSILSLITLSKILSLPLEKIPSASFLRQETFLENILFKNLFAPKNLSNPNPREHHTTQSASFFRGTPEFDIGPMLPALILDFFNIGFETVDCKCCSPEHRQAENMLPNTIVTTEILKDAFYFESTSPEFSQEFHEKQPMKEHRTRRKKEFFLAQFPIGPFHRNQCQELLLQDALLLEKNRDAKITEFKIKHWFCTKKASFISKTIKEAKEIVAQTSVFIENTQNNCFSKSGILGCIAIEKNQGLQMAQEFKNNLEFFITNLPAHLSNPETRFFDEEIANAITCIRDNAIYAFNSISAKNKPSIKECLIAIKSPMN
ncbi:MAG: hypothetical protein JW772_01920 [Candidatus Diapherotrites archaeon]|nr:hypothetical protein [Candidatus Diapherotrites archaeon]